MEGKFFVISLILMGCNNDRIQFDKYLEYDINEKIEILINSSEEKCNLILPENTRVYYDCFNLKINNENNICRSFLIHGTEFTTDIIISFLVCIDDEKIIVKNINWSRGYHFLDLKIKGKDNEDDFEYIVKNYIDKIFK